MRFCDECPELARCATMNKCLRIIPESTVLPDEVGDTIQRLRAISDGFEQRPYQICSTASIAADLIERLAPRWTKVPETESLGAYLTGIPGQPIYAVDERTNPFSNWRLELPPLPPQKGST